MIVVLDDVMNFCQFHAPFILFYINRVVIRLKLQRTFVLVGHQDMCRDREIEIWICMYIGFRSMFQEISGYLMSYIRITRTDFEGQHVPSMCALEENLFVRSGGVCVSVCFCFCLRVRVVVCVPFTHTIYVSMSAIEIFHQKIDNERAYV